MTTNLDRYKKDLDALLETGHELLSAMQAQALPEEYERALAKHVGKKKAAETINSLPSFLDQYQPWYSEAKSLIRQLLPDRLEDLVRHYEKPKPRKEITWENYRIEDYLQSLTVNRGWQNEKIVGPEAAIPQFRQQLAIVTSVKNRFESSLFDVRQIVQADLFDCELDTAAELARNGFARAAGAVAGVVLERHLAQVCANHAIAIKKKPCISDLNNAVKESGVADIPTWRFVQHLGDIRNLCDHGTSIDPTTEQVNDLVAGVKKITKTLF
jgi:hypothetical protein